MNLISNSRRVLLVLLVLSIVSVRAADQEALIDDSRPLDLPPVGAHQLRILTPKLLELTLVTTKDPDPARVRQWDFVTNETLRLPEAGELAISSGGRKSTVQKVGFKRRVLYAPLRQRDLRIANELYLELTEPVRSNEAVEVKNPSGRLWPAAMHFTAKMDPLRWSPILHVNQIGYAANASKKAMVGYYLGSLGELELPKPEKSDTNGPSFTILDASGNTVAFTGALKPRLDSGFPFRCYQRVLEADFSSLHTPGEYRLNLEGFGVSFPFWIGDPAVAALARTYALGLYHQRCGTNNLLPYTRHTHDPCHTALASIPLPLNQFSNAWGIIAGKTTDAKKEPRHVAPPPHRSRLRSLSVRKKRKDRCFGRAS